jgi:hypothetical protein
MARPSLKPTAEQRRLVKSLSACGIPQEHIAGRLGIRSLKTLRKYYREELDAGILDANASVGKTMYTMANSGRFPLATMFWLRCRAGWKDYPAYEQHAAAPPPFIVAKDDGARN